MTKDFRCALFSGVILLGFSVNGQAALYDRGNNLLYDSDLDITWLSDGNYALTSGYINTITTPGDGRMTFNQSVTWASQLSYAGFTNWRLPSTLQPDDPSCDLLEYTGPGDDNGQFYLYNCTGSEMGHLFYTELSAIIDINTNSAVFNESFFTGLEHRNYWSGTESNPEPAEGFPTGCIIDCVWDFDFKNGVQTGYPKNSNFFALAVHSGDIGNTAPTITSTAVTNATEDVEYSYAFTASDVNADNALTLSAPVLPPWLIFNSSTGVLSGTASNADVGTHSVTLRVNDGLVDVDQSFTVSVANVNDPPTITSTEVTTANTSAVYSYTLTATDVDVGDVLVFSAPIKPTWLSFNATNGELSGTPGSSDVGDNFVTLRVSDGSVNVDQVFTIVVANDPPTITSTEITVATEDVAYSYTLTAFDVNGDTLTFSAPVLPAWLSFNPASGVLSGTPANADVGIHFVTLRVTDGTANVDQSFSIIVDNVNDAPTINGTAPTSVAEDSLYNFTPIANDVDVGDSLTFSIVNQPTWASFNSTTGLLSGTPTNADVGSTTGIVITVTDSALASASLPAFNIQVNNSNDAPIVTSTALTTATENALYSYTFTASDIDASDVLTYSAPLLPAWLSFNTTTGILTGTPGNAEVGSHGVTLRVNDGTVTVEQNFSITVSNVNSAPSISGTPGTVVAEDSSYSFTPVANDEDVGDTLSFSIINQPGWASFDTSSGILSGTPLNADVGTTTGIVITVTDSELASASLPAFDLLVSNTNDAPIITSTALTSAIVDTAYSYTLIASDIDVGDELIMSAPLLPAWLSFNPATGVLSGTPTNAELGNHSVILRVNDGSENVEQSFTITVTNDPPTITSTPVTIATEDVVYSYTFTATDVNADVLTFSAPQLPGWLIFNTTTGVLSGTPTNANVGGHAVTLRVNDGSVDVDQSFTITVSNVNDAPQISGTPPSSIAEDSAYSFTPIASDVDAGDSLSFSIVNQPAWASFNASTGLLSGTPTNANVGSTTGIVITVTDSALASASLPAFNIQVNNTNDAPNITSTALTTASENVPYSYTFSASDVDVGDTLTYSAPTLPGWLSFDTGSGLLTGTPGNAEVGNHSVTLRVNDGTVNVDQSFSIIVSNVNDAPTITSSPVISATEDVPYTYTFSASDVDAGDTLTYSAPILPGWLSFNATSGELSGTPDNAAVGNHAVTLRVNDGTVNVDQSFSITVSNVNDAPIITSTALTTASENIAYSYTFSVNDIDVGDVLTLSATVIPGWLSFDTGSGLLTGTPGNAEVGNHSVTLRVNDGTVNVDQSFSIIVSNVNDAPTITSSPVISATEDVLYTYTFSASDVDAGDTLTYSAPTIPGWLSFNATSGELSGTPDNAAVGNHAVILRVNDGTVDVDQSFSIAVSNVNDAPIITSTALTTASENLAYSYTFTASDIDVGDSLTLSAIVLPPWLGFNAGSGLLTGTPTNAEVGNHSVTLRVNDGTVNVDQSFTIIVSNVNDVPIITSTPVTSATEDVPYTYTFSASDLDAGDTLTYRAPTIPGWLSFNATSGVLSGTPDNAAVGNHAVTLRVNDGTVDVDQSFIITVSNVNDAPVISGTPLTSIAEDSAYSFTPIASDVDAGDSLSFSIVNKPAWTSFNTSTGLLSGTPTNADVGSTTGIVITVTDSALATASLTAFDLLVSNTNDAPVITSTALTAVSENVLYSYTFSASDLDVGDSLTYSAPTLPGWLSFDTGSGLLTGTPSNADVGNHSVTLSVTDGTVNVDQSFIITVNNVNDAPVISGTPLSSIAEDSAYSFTPIASDVDAGDSLSFSIVNQPAWASFNTSTGLLSGTPTNADVGSTTGIVITVTDSALASASLPAFDLLVSNTNDAPVITSTAQTAVSENVLYSYTFSASDVDVGDSLTYSAPTLPGWLNFNTGSGVLNGIPANAEVGNHSVTLRVTDGTVNIDQSFIITVSNVNDDPTINSTPVISAIEDVLYSYTFSASDIDISDVLTYSAPVLPGWLNFSATSGVLSGVPDNATVGNHPVTLRVSDGTVNVDQSFSINVVNVNDAPVISGIPGTVVAEGSPYNFSPIAEDVDAGDSLSFSIVNQPAWASFNPATGALTGTPDNTDAGVTNGIVITVTDNSSASASLPAFNLTVSNTNIAPTISGTPATSVLQDSSYSFTPVASDEDVGETLVFSISNAPAWANFNPATGALTGTPTNSDVGITNDILITVTDGSSATATLPGFNLQVINVNDSPVITSTALTTAAENSVYSYNFTVNDIDATDVLILSAPLLPDWLSFNTTSGVLSGTPGNTEVGSHAVTLRVSDGVVSVEQSFTIIVGNVNDAPTITSTPITIATEDLLYSYSFTASDIDAGNVLTYSAPLIPDWLSFNATTGVLSGTPGNDEVGNHALTLRVNDGIVNVDQSFSITVNNVNDAPVITSTAITSATENVVYSYNFTVSDIDVGDVLTLSAPIKPDWLSFNAGSGILTGTPGNAEVEVGSFSVTLRVNDGAVNVDQSFSISIGNINDIPVISGTPLTRTIEGLLYTFEPEATDADPSDNLVFVINTKPAWASFDTLTGVLSGTPAAVNIGITTGVLIGVSDGTVTVNLPVFDLTVVGDLDGDGLADDVDLDIDGDGINNDDEATYGLDPRNPADALLDADGDGRSNFEEIVEHGTNPLLDEEPPEVSAPGDITLVSTGLYTQINFAEATADDNVDGTLPVINDVDDHLPPGSHVVTWSAVDQAGNIGSATQAINIIPLVEFAPDQVSTEGSTVNVKFVLNGSAVGSVEVPYTVSGTALFGEDHNLALSGSISISSGTEAVLSFNIMNDNLVEPDENIIITMGTPLHAALGSRVVHIIKIVETNIAPQVVLSAEQDQGITHIVSQSAGPVTVFAEVTDPDNENHSYDWSGSDNALGVVDTGDNTFIFDPVELMPGLYHIRLNVSDGIDNDEAELALNIVSPDSIPELSTTDSDGDGVDDLTEGYADSDNDGVPNYLDAIEVQNVLQAQSGSSAQNLMETESGLSLALGLVALQANPGQAAVSTDDILNYTDSVKDVYDNVGGLFDFGISDLPIAGQSVRVVLPQSNAIPAKAVYRKLMPGGWQDFIENSRNTLSSAAGESAYCPPPGDISYTPGLTEGDWCVQVLIEDGGPNDADTLVNRRVLDPGGLAQLKTTVVSGKSSGGGALFSLLLYLIIWRLCIRVKGRCL